MLRLTTNVTSSPTVSRRSESASAATASSAGPSAVANARYSSSEQSGRIALGRAQRRGHVGVDALGRTGGQLPHLLPDGLPVAERAVQVAACGGQPSLGVDSRVQIDPPERFGRLVGLLPGPTDRSDVERETGVGIGKRGDMALHARVDPCRARLHVGRLGGQPLYQVVTRLGGDRGQLVQRRPRPFGVDVIGRQR